MTTYYFDPISGVDGNNGLSFANRKKNLTGFVGAVAGDTCRIIASPDPTSLGVNGTWTDLSPTVTLASAVTLNIDTCNVAWTAATNVTQSTLNTSGNFKEGTAAQRLAVAAAFSTGRIGHHSLGGTVDFSGYQQVSFWIRVTGVSVAANVLQIRLCSDTGGVTAVNTIPISIALVAGTWTTITLDTAGALGSNIQSVALYANTDPGAVTVDLDNIIACKASSSADSLSLTSVIGKNTAGETFYALQSINGTTVILGGVVTLTSGSVNLRGYHGTTETVTTYKRDTLFIPNNNSQTVASWGTFGLSGTAASPITISGGWNRTDMSTQTGETWLACRSNANVGMRFATQNYVNISKLSFVQFYIGIYQTLGSSYINIDSCNFNAGFAYGTFSDGDSSLCTISNCTAHLNGNYGLNPGHSFIISNCKLNGNAVTGLLFGNGTRCVVNDVECVNGTNYGVDFYVYGEHFIKNLVTSSNAVASILYRNGNNYLLNASIGETIEAVASANLMASRVYSMTHDTVVGNDFIFSDAGVIQSETGADRDVASGLAWKLSPTSSNATTTYPIRLGGARQPDSVKVACDANTQVTVSVRIKRSNTGITARIVCPGGQIAGVPSDVSASASGGAGSYETVSISFTPTEKGVIDIFLEAFGGTTFSAWFDTMTFNQV